MGENEDVNVARLQKLGLNLYESKAYLALLSKGTLTAKDLGRSASIPQSRTYDVLESLTEKGFAVSTPTSPTAYAAVSPSRTLGSHYSSEKKKVQERAAKVQEEAAEELESLSEAYLALTKELPTAARGEAGAPAAEVWVIQKRENIENAMVTMIQEAKRELLRITKPPEPGSRQPFDPFYIVGMEDRRFVFDALERGVKMRWLSLSREIPSFVGLDVTEPPERRYLEDEADVTEKFYLADGKDVLLNLRDPASLGYGTVALVMRSKAASSIFREHFDKMWDRAKPLKEVLPGAKSLVEDVCSGLRELGLAKADVQLFRASAMYGATAQDELVSEVAKRKVNTADAAASIERLIQLGLMHRDPTFKLLMVENPAKIIDSIKKGSVDLGARAR